MASDAPVSDVRGSVRSAALWTVSGILGSRVLGVVRQTVVSAVFGASTAGVLRVALNIPDLIFYLVAGGAIRSGFMPVFIDLETKGRDDPALRQRAWRLFSAVITGILVVAGGLVLLAHLFAPWLILPLAGRAQDLPLIGHWFGVQSGGLTDTEVAEAVRLTRLLMPAQICLLVGGVLAAALNALERFEVTSLVPGYYNIVMIGAVVWLGQPERLGLAAAAWGLVLGACTGHFVWQAFELWRVGRAEGAYYRPILAWRDPEVQRVLRVAWPIMLGLCAAEVNLKVSSAVIARFGSDAVSWFDNASRLARLPDGLFGAGLGLALFPFLSKLASRGEMDRFRAESEHILKLACLCAMPCFAMMLVSPLPLTGALYAYGNYLPSVAPTAALLPWCAVSILPITLTVVMTRAFYAVEDSQTPLRIGAVAVAFGVVCNVLFGSWFGYIGPPLAMGVTSLVNLVGLGHAYRRRIGYADLAGLSRMTLLCLLAAVLAAGLGAAVAALLPGWGYPPVALVVLAVNAVVYLGALRLLGVREVQTVFALARRRRR